jgi:gliding motility-associated protein GldM
VKSEAVALKSKEILEFINKIKTDLEGKESRVDENGELKYNVLQNTDVVTRVFFKGDGTSTEVGDQLITKLNEFNTFIGSKVFNTEDVTRGGNKVSWLFSKFYGQPQVAANTALTQIQNQVINAESEMIRKFLSKKVIENVEINDFKGIISSPGILVKGSTATTYASIGAFDNKLQGTVIVNGRSFPLQGGKATIPLETGSLGTKTLAGSITFKDPSGKTQTRPLESVTYEVTERTANTQLPDPDGVVSAEKMNVVYRGLPNPIVASVTGAAAGTVSLSGPGLVKSGNGWVLTPSSGQSVTLNLSAKNEEGKAFSKAFTFRIKNIPPPQGQIRGQNTVSMPASALENQVVEAKIPDFDWPVNFQVTSCKVKVSGKPTLSIQGASLKAASAIVKGLRSGDVVNVFDIKVVATGLGDQQIKNVSPVAVSIQ